MVTITRKRVSPTFVGNLCIIPGTHSYSLTEEETVELETNELLSHEIEKGITTITRADGMSVNTIKAIGETASAKELEALLADVEKYRKAAISASEKAEAEGDVEKKQKATEKAAKAADLYTAAEAALASRRAEIETLKNKENEGGA